MSTRAVLLAGALLLASGRLAGQVPLEERILIRDPDRLEALGFPRDARNVYVWSKAGSNAGRVAGLQGPSLNEMENGATAGGYSTIHGSQILGYLPQNFVYRDDSIYTTNDGTYCQEAPCNAFAPLLVPEGAKLGFLRFWGHDSELDGDLHLSVYETCQPLGTTTPTSTLISEGFTSGTPGDFSSFASLDGVTANNRDCVYTVYIHFGEPGDPDFNQAIRVRKLNVSWTRQVSPAPATASFDDVPTGHPFFQFIEALSKSGTTAGCQTDPPQYCPDRPITRGEMAVYLAKALGLQWP